MAANWPTGLPTSFLVGKKIRRQGRGNTLRNETLSGRFKTRRISTKSHRVIEGEIAVTLDQIATLETFYNTTLKDGTMPFQGFRHPFTGLNTVWYFTEDPVQENYPNDGRLFTVPLSLLALPDAPT